MREWSSNGGGRQKGKGNRKTRTLAEGAGDFDGAAVRFSNPFADGQAEAGAFLRVRPGGIRSIKPVEDETLLIRGHADPLILNGHPGHPAVSRQTKLYGSLGQ